MKSAIESLAASLRQRARWLGFALCLLPCLPARLLGAEAGAPDSFAPFQIIAQRNIFAPESARRLASSEKLSPPRLDSLVLVGTLSYAKGQFAFFDGSDPGFKQVLEPGASIGGCVVTAIAFKQVTLKSGGVEFELPVGARLLREDPGQWKFGGKAELVSPTVETVAQKSQPPDSTSSGQSAKTAAALAAEVDEYDKWAAKKLSKYLAGGSSEPKKDKQWGKISRAFNEDAPRKPEKPRKRDQG